MHREQNSVELTNKCWMNLSETVWVFRDFLWSYLRSEEWSLFVDISWSSDISSDQDSIKILKDLDFQCLLLIKSTLYCRYWHVDSSNGTLGQAQSRVKNASANYMSLWQKCLALTCHYQLKQTHLIWNMVAIVADQEMGNLLISWLR